MKSFLIVAAKDLFTVLFVVFVAVLAIVLICAGPIAAIAGYNAIVARLRTDDAENSLVSDGLESMSSARQRRIVGAYVERYGVDLNVVLTIGGLVMTIPGLYLGGHTAALVLDLLPDVHL